MATILKLNDADAAEPGLLSGPVQRQLAHWNRKRLSPSLPAEDWQRELSADQRMLHLQGQVLELQRDQIAEAAALAPADPRRFIEWFEALRDAGPGQHDPLFPWLAEAASLDEMRWYIRQEAAGEAGFDDLTAYTQVKLPVQVKLELARNYWDEMGRGNIKGMHGPMLERLVRALGVEADIDSTVKESLNLANTMTAMATRRDFAWHAVGALGVIELTAPSRSSAVAAGLKRLGVSAKARNYFDLHATLDVKHSEAWNREAILPAVAEDPARARAMAEGALIRLTCGARCFDRYRRELW
jgi:hypothetical protein